METLNMKDNLLLRRRKPSRVGPRRRGAEFLLLPNQSRLGTTASDKLKNEENHNAEG